MTRQEEQLYIVSSGYITRDLIDTNNGVLCAEKAVLTSYKMPTILFDKNIWGLFALGGNVLHS